MIRPEDITVCIPAHPARGRADDPSTMFGRAVASVQAQTWGPSPLSLAMDLDRAGAAVTRQRALDAVTTPWTAFLDSDDFFLPGHLEALAGHAEDTGADYVYSWFKIMTPIGLILERDTVFPPGHYLDPWDPERPRQTTITIMVRTDLIREAGGFMTQPEGPEIGGLRAGEDFDMTVRCNQIGRISHLVQKTWIWHHHGMNSSGLPGQGDAA